MDQLLLTVAQCCQIAAIGRTKFYELLAKGEIPARKLGKRTLIAASDLRTWVERLPSLEVSNTEHASEKSPSGKATR